MTYSVVMVPSPVLMAIGSPVVFERAADRLMSVVPVPTTANCSVARMPAPLGPDAAPLVWQPRSLRGHYM